MKTYLKRIKGTLPFNHTNIDMDITSKALIVTGKTGSGKTAFLRFIYEKIEGSTTNKELKTLPRLLTMLENLRSGEKPQAHSTPGYDQWQKSLQKIEDQLDDITRELSLDIAKKSPQHAIKSRGFIRFYDANRTTYILPATEQHALAANIQNTYGDYADHARYLEQYLLSVKYQQANSSSTDSTTNKLQKIERCLSTLLGDPTTALLFDTKKLNLRLTQKQRPDFSFQDLSHGHLAILSIWADLLIRAEAYHTTPEQFKGIVIIDEIDSHLDIALQRIVLPLLIAQFPCIQFIVSTNSPLVVMSIDQSIIFDMSTGSSAEQDFSFYSYNAIASEVFHTDIASAIRTHLT